MWIWWQRNQNFEVAGLIEVANMHLPPPCSSGNCYLQYLKNKQLGTT